jgi:hypothetical protein
MRAANLNRLNHIKYSIQAREFLQQFSPAFNQVFDDQTLRTNESGVGIIKKLIDFQAKSGELVKSSTGR